jgi:hypothetical protein
MDKVGGVPVHPAAGWKNISPNIDQAHQTQFEPFPGGKNLIPEEAPDALIFPFR